MYNESEVCERANTRATDSTGVANSTQCAQEAMKKVPSFKRKPSKKLTVDDNKTAKIDADDSPTHKPTHEPLPDFLSPTTPGAAHAAR